MLQGVGEDGENMRNLLFSVFSRFSLLLPFLSPTPEEINPHSFRFSMQTWEEIPTVSVLLAGTGGGIQGSLHGVPHIPHPVGVCEGCPSRAWLRDHRDTSDFCSALPHPFHTAPDDLPVSSSLQKLWKCLYFFPLAGDSLCCKGFGVTLCQAQSLCFAAPPQQRLAPVCHPQWQALFHVALTF